MSFDVSTRAKTQYPLIKANKAPRIPLLVNLETKIYQKQNHTKIGKLFLESVRDIKAQYRQSYLGIIWAFVTPLTTAFLWMFLNVTGTKLSDTGVPYPVYAFSGTLLVYY